MLQGTAGADGVAVYLELGVKRVFACALDWPGWCRSGRTEDQALEALAAYAPRYAAIAAEGGLRLPPPRFEIVERLAGSATTDFGAPDCIATRDRAPQTEADGDRMSTLVSAAWTVLDRVHSGSPSALRKGPRGGGRDRDAIAQHVFTAEAAYARKLGISQPEPRFQNRAAIERLRLAILAALGARTPDAPANGWPVRYAARRIAWHTLDHAWEMEDRGGANRS